MSRIPIKSAVLCLICLSCSVNVGAQIVTCTASKNMLAYEDEVDNAKIKKHNLKSTQLKSIKKTKNSTNYMGIFKVLIPNIMN